MNRAAPVPRYPRSPFYGPASVAGNAVLMAETPFLQRRKTSSRLIYAFEVWSGSNRLFPESLDASPKSKQVAYPLTSNMLRHAAAV
jgi:hypothetical protein